jgi:hypothetical protein
MTDFLSAFNSSLCRLIFLLARIPQLAVSRCVRVPRMFRKVGVGIVWIIFWFLSWRGIFLTQQKSAKKGLVPLFSFHIIYLSIIQSILKHHFKYKS